MSELNLKSIVLEYELSVTSLTLIAHVKIVSHRSLMYAHIPPTPTHPPVTTPHNISKPD